MADRIEDKDLLVLDSKEIDTSGRYEKPGYKLRIVQWLYARKDGDVGWSVKLERRKYFHNKDGEERNKADGFSLDDLALIQKRWKEIIEIMKNPPEPAFAEKEKEPEQEQAPAGGEPGLEEVPF